jgi:hypothetical protein
VPISAASERHGRRKALGYLKEWQGTESGGEAEMIG